MVKETFQKKYNVVFLINTLIDNNYLIDFSYILYMITGWHIKLKTVNVHAKSSDTYIVIVFKIGN